MKLCDYGCGQEAIHALKNGKQCCNTRTSSCPAVRRKNSEGLKKAHADGRCTTKHFTKEMCACNKGKVFVSDNIFTKNSTSSTASIKNALLKLGKIEYECSECTLTSWQNKPISLELDHIDGNRTNNELNNLRLLCPNCHAQTNTFRGRNIGTQGNVKVTNDELLNALMVTKNIREALIKVKLAASGGNYIRAKKLLVFKNSKGL